MENPNKSKEPQSSFRGLYRHVNISVGTLDKVIVGGILVIVLLLAFGIANNGYTVSFDSKGGSDVSMQTDIMYGDVLELPPDPTREGYTFSGWYIDENCIYQWDSETMLVSQDMTLYAGWKRVNQ